MKAVRAGVGRIRIAHKRRIDGTEDVFATTNFDFSALEYLWLVIALLTDAEERASSLADLEEPAIVPLRASLMPTGSKGCVTWTERISDACQAAIYIVNILRRKHVRVPEGSQRSRQMEIDGIKFPLGGVGGLMVWME